jgi:hypothetical protein
MNEEKLNEIIQRIENLEKNNVNKLTRKELLELLCKMGFIRDPEHGYYNGSRYYRLDDTDFGYITLDSYNQFYYKIDFYSSIENIMQDIEKRLQEYLEEFKSVFISDILTGGTTNLSNLIDDLKAIISLLPNSKQEKYSAILEKHIEIYNQTLEDQKNETKKLKGKL